MHRLSKNRRVLQLYGGESKVFQKLRATIADCQVDGSRFVNLSAKDGFWSCRNRWRSCEFRSVRLDSPIPSANHFVDCLFEEVQVSRWRPSQVLFERCRFSRFAVEGMKAAPWRNVYTMLPELDGRPDELAFVDCHFEEPSFAKCYFNKVRFERCVVHSPAVRACDFKGIFSDKRWWGEEEYADPFVEFLRRQASAGGRHRENASSTAKGPGFDTSPETVPCCECLVYNELRQLVEKPRFFLRFRVTFCLLEALGAK